MFELSLAVYCPVVPQRGNHLGRLGVKRYWIACSKAATSKFKSTNFCRIVHSLCFAQLFLTPSSFSVFIIRCIISHVLRQQSIFPAVSFGFVLFSAYQQTGVCSVGIMALLNEFIIYFGLDPQSMKHLRQERVQLRVRFRFD